MLEKFVAFQLSRELYKKCKPLRLPRFLHDQLLRASSSVALNLAEGSGKRTAPEQKRFYAIAFGSLRECQAILLLEDINNQELMALTDRLGAILFKLTRKSANRTDTATETATTAD